MFKKSLLATAILSIASLLMATDSAFAQHGGHGGGGRGGGGHAGGAHVGGGHYVGHVGGAHYAGHVGGAYGRSYGGGYGRGYGSGGYGRGYFGRGYYNGGYGYYPGYFGGYYYPGYDINPWYSTYPDYSYPDYSYPDYSSYDAPAGPYYGSPTQYVTPPASIATDSASIRVIVPDPQAQVWFDGNGTSQTGTDRLFHTPSLTMGTNYTYRIRAAWVQSGRQVAQERTVSVAPGQTSVVDFAH